MKPVVYLVCGVPGSGKTWVCEQLDRARYTYVPHDDHIDGDLVAELETLAREGDGPFVTECPFGERELKKQLEFSGFKVLPYFVVEPTEVVEARYRKRTGKALPKAAATRSKSILKRADEWDAPRGTAAEVLGMLRGGKKGAA